MALWLASHKATYRLLLFPLDFVPEVFVDREPAVGFAKVGYWKRWSPLVEFVYSIKMLISQAIWVAVVVVVVVLVVIA